MTVSELRRALFDLDNQDSPAVVSCEQLTACEPFDLGRIVGLEMVDGMAVLQIANPESTDKD